MSTNFTPKPAPVAQNVVTLDSIDHLKKRAELYMDTGNRPDVVLLSWNSDGSKLITKSSNVSMKEIHMFKEIMGNAVDAAIPGSTINVRIKVEDLENVKFRCRFTIEVENIGVKYIKSEDLLPCFFDFRTGSNFDDGVQSTIGRNGIGAKIVPVMASSFYVESYGDGKLTSLSVTDYGNNKIMPVPEIKNVIENHPRVKVRWSHEISAYAAKSINYDSVALQFALGRNVRIFRSISKDGKTDCKELNDLWGKLPMLLQSTTLTAGRDGEIEYYVGDRSEACLKILPSFMVVNGLYCLAKGSQPYSTYVSRLVQKLIKQYETAKASINTAFVDDKLVILCRFNDSKCKFTSQAKGTVQEVSVNYTEIKMPQMSSSWPLFSELVGKARRKILEKVKPLNNLENTSYVPPTTKTHTTLFIGEGDSTRGYLNVMREKMGVNCTGIFVLTGKCRNFIDVSVEDIANNKIAISLMSALGINLLSSEDIRYSNIVLAADADDDGKHIIVLVYTLFVELWPELLNRIMILMPHVEREYAGSKIVRRSLMNTGTCARGNELKYFKGLGSCEALEIEDDFLHAPVLKLSATESSIRAFKDVMGSINSRRNVLLVDESQISMPECTRTLAGMKSTISHESFDFSYLWLIFYRAYMKRSIERAIPAWNDGMKDCVRKIIRTVKSRKLIEQKVDSLANATSEYCDYHHGAKSLSDAIVRLAQPYHSQLPILIGQGQFGTVNGNDCASSRYLSVKPAPYFKYLFPFSGEQCLLPYALINGTTGIATGWQSNIPHVPLSQLFYNIERYLFDRNYVMGFDIPPYYHGAYRDGNIKTITTPAWGQTMGDIKSALRKQNVDFTVGEHGHIHVINITDEALNRILRVTTPRNITFNDGGCVKHSNLTHCLLNTIKECLIEYNEIRMSTMEKHRLNLEKKRAILLYCLESRGRKFESRQKLREFAKDIGVEFSIASAVTDLQRTDDSIEDLKTEIKRLEAFTFISPEDMYFLGLKELKAAIGGNLESLIAEFAKRINANQLKDYEGVESKGDAITIV